MGSYWPVRFDGSALVPGVAQVVFRKKSIEKGLYTMCISMACLWDRDGVRTEASDCKQIF